EVRDDSRLRSARSASRRPLPVNVTSPDQRSIRKYHRAPYSGCVVIVVLIAACWLLDKIYDAVRRWLRDSGANSASGA
ncbi:hypothetical protein, partial [Methylosinus sporium]|uniref:hypothetical protein n=1 Tax=Methylosinus sporium TaxID=428 RepID=UPI001AEE7CF7